MATPLGECTSGMAAGCAAAARHWQHAWVAKSARWGEEVTAAAAETDDVNRIKDIPCAIVTILKSSIPKTQLTQLRYPQLGGADNFCQWSL